MAHEEIIILLAVNVTTRFAFVLLGVSTDRAPKVVKIVFLSYKSLELWRYTGEEITVNENRHNEKIRLTNKFAYYIKFYVGKQPCYDNYAAGGHPFPLQDFTDFSILFLVVFVNGIL